MCSIISTENLKYIYSGDSEINADDITALKNVSLNVGKGEFITILGRNGSGKSTLARILNALLIPTEGVCIVGGMDSKKEENHWEIRKMCGMVFQNPDNQIIGTSVEEDVAFGLENIGVQTEEIRIRIDEAMKCVGIYEKRESAPHLLSGGQKQRVAITGILAMRPQCIILDEATAMLDPIGRKEVVSVIRQLNREYKMTILHITHHMDEAVFADRVIVVDDGEIKIEGTPKTVFSKAEELKKLGLDVPQVTELFAELKRNGIELPKDILTVEEAVKYLAPMIERVKNV